jgi:hypothetical protein
MTSPLDQSAVLGCPCYALAEFLHKILSSLAGSMDTMKNSEHFIEVIQEINLQNEDYLVSFAVISLFTNIPVEEVSQVIRNRLNTDPSFPEHSPLQVEEVMELLDICITYFQFEDKFYQQNEGMAVEYS